MVMPVSFEFARPFSLAKQPSVPEDYQNNDGNSITFIIIILKKKKKKSPQTFPVQAKFFFNFFETQKLVGERMIPGILSKISSKTE